MCCLDTWWNLEGLEGLTTSSPSHSAPVHKVLELNNPLYQMNQAQFLLIPEQQVSALCQSVEFFKQAKDTFSLQSGGTSPSWYYKACHPQSLVFHSGPEYNPYKALCDKALSFSIRLWICVYLPIWRLVLAFIWASTSLCFSILGKASPGFLITHH